MLRKAGLVLGALFAVASAIVAVNVLRHWALLTPGESVRFTSNGIELAGTFIKPADEGTFPGVILLHGSGPETRSEPTTRAVMNALVRNGFAVLAYDKRGAGESQGDFDAALYKDFIDDAIAAVNFMVARKDVDSQRLGIYAVSEGAWFAPEIASRTGLIAFIFNKVGPPISRFEQFQWEVRNEYIADGIAESDVAEVVELAARRWNFYLAGAADPAVRQSAERDAINAEIARLRSDVPGAEQAMATELGEFDDDWYAAFAADAAYDPTPYLLELDIPMFYAYGSADVNMPTEQCIDVIQWLVADYDKNIDFVVYPGLGHSLGTWKGLFSMGFPPGYLERLGQWTSAQVAAR